MSIARSALLFLTAGALSAEVIVSPELNQRVFPPDAFSHADYSEYPVDVDADTIPDLWIRAVKANQLSEFYIVVVTAPSVSATCFNIPIPGEGNEPNFIAAFTTHAAGQSIGANWDFFHLWASGEFNFHGFEIAGGIPARDGYLGVRIQRMGLTRYGWVRLIFPQNYDHFEETGYLKIKETAYETTPFQAITAGVGRSEISIDATSKITPQNPATIRLYASGESGLAYALKESSNLTDWTIVYRKFSETGSVEVNRPIEATPTFYKWSLSENFEDE